MSSLSIVREVQVTPTPRLLQLSGMFDVPLTERSTERWTVNLNLPDAWNVGLIVGPSGSGKTTIAKELFGQYMVRDWSWPENKSILDGFPSGMSIKDIVDLLSSVGFSSPPSWVRPFRVLSNGEQFRVNMARTLAEMPVISVVDEFTSVVDRTVAQIGSAAIAKTTRRRNQKFVAVTCHYDIAEWLEPDWIYQPQTDTLTVGRSLCRPQIKLVVRRVHSSAWSLFRKHHYLDASINSSSKCFVAFWDDVPVAFASVLHFPHPKSKNTKRGHRTVCLPDYQGVGIGNALSNYVASIVRGIGARYYSITSHPAMIRTRAHSTIWKMRETGGEVFPGEIIGKVRDRTQSKRLRYSFEYVGPAMNREQAIALWND